MSPAGVDWGPMPSRTLTFVCPACRQTFERDSEPTIVCVAHQMRRDAGWECCHVGQRVVDPAGLPQAATFGATCEPVNVYPGAD